VGHLAWPSAALAESAGSTSESQDSARNSDKIGLVLIASGITLLATGLILDREGAVKYEYYDPIEDEHRWKDLDVETGPFYVVAGLLVGVGVLMNLVPGSGEKSPGSGLFGDIDGSSHGDACVGLRLEPLPEYGGRLVLEVTF